MIFINKNTFEYVLSEFNKITEIHKNENIVCFKTNNYIDEHENYKYAILEQAKNALLTKTWKEKEIGNGRILESVKNSMPINVAYNYKIHNNNLIDWRIRDNFSRLKANHKIEKIFFEFYKNKIKDETAFNLFSDLGFSYQLIAYLFFIKNHRRYLPISQRKFDLIFDSLNIDFKTSNNSSWENYQKFIGIIKQFQNYLKMEYKKVELLDAHSFLWVYGNKFEKNKEKKHQPSKAIELENLIEPETEIDFIEKLNKQIEIGNLAEKIVIKNEIELLSNNYPDLANKVHSVANNPKLGFDIVSFETDGTQKQIEVKAISTKNEKKSFFLTKNELEKSKKYPNYYLYCVYKLNSINPQILKIKQPNFENKNEFDIEPLIYKITIK